MQLNAISTSFRYFEVAEQSSRDQLLHAEFCCVVLDADSTPNCIGFIIPRNTASNTINASIIRTINLRGRFINHLCCSYYLKDGGYKGRYGRGDCTENVKALRIYNVKHKPYKKCN